MTVLVFLASVSLVAAGEAGIDDVIREFRGEAPPVKRTPLQLQMAYSQALDALLPKMGSEKIPERQGPEQTFQRICWRAGRPGAETERAAVCKAIVAKLQSPLPKTARVWLLKQLEHIGRGEAVDCLAALLRDKDPLIRERARRALQNNPTSEAAGVLVRALRAARTPRWRVALINALGYRKDAAALKALIAQSRGEEQVRTAAFEALARIGDDTAADAIAAGMTKGSDRARAIATDCYLLLADKLAERKERATALTMYRKLLRSTGHIKCAAIIGIGRAGGVKELDTIFNALADKDPRVRGAGLSALGLLPAREVTQVMIAKIKSAEPAMKVVLLRALAQGGDKDSLPAFLAAASDPNEDVRVAAFEGMGKLRSERAAPVLVAAVAKAKGRELGAAKAAINRIPGESVTNALVKAMERADASGRVEVVRCLAVRRPASVVPILLRAAEDRDASVRAEALKVVGDLADESTLPSLVKLLVKARESREREAAERTVVAVCKRIDDEEKRAAPLFAALPGAGATARASLLRVLGRLGGDKALEAVRAGIKDGSPEVRDAAIRAMAKWPDGKAAPDLLDLARNAKSLTHRVLALDGYVRAIGLLEGLPAGKALKMFEDAMAAAPRPEDRKRVLSGVAGVPNLGALRMAQRHLADPALRSEAEAAVVQVARAISGTHQAQAEAALKSVIAVTKNERLRKQARDVIALIQRFDDYITAWLVSGPYTKRGTDGPGLFNVLFPPEKPDAKGVKWRPMPVATDRGRPWLIEPDKDPALRGNDRAAYFRTRLWSPKKQKVRMELGSDDGVKIWLNGGLVHANNSFRPCAPGQDKKNVTLQEGWNDLLIKLTQGGGQWALCLRFRAPDGSQLKGLRADPHGK